MGKLIIGIDRDRGAVRDKGESASADDVTIKTREELWNYDDKMRIKKLSIS